MWTFPATCACRDSHRILGDLLAALKAKADAGFKARAAERVKRLAEEGKVRRERRPRRGANPGSWPDQSEFPVRRAGQGFEALRHRAERGRSRNGRCRSQQMPRTQAGTLVGPGRRWAGLLRRHGAWPQLAMPERTVVQIVGDGTFYFSNPQSTLAVSRHYKLPVLNRRARQFRLGCVKEATLRVYPDGKPGPTVNSRHAGARHGFCKVAKRRCAWRVGQRSRLRRRRDRPLPRRRAVGRSAVLHAKVATVASHSRRHDRKRPPRPLRRYPWDNRHRNGCDRQIVSDALTHFDEKGFWAAHPMDNTKDGRSDFYMGAAGMIWAIDYLRRVGATATAIDFRPVLARLLATRRRKWRDMATMRRTVRSFRRSWNSPGRHAFGTLGSDRRSDL